MAKQRIGGSFAPPLSDETIVHYKSIALGASPEVREAMQVLLNCVERWWALPESGPEGSRPHPSGRGTIVPLDDPIAAELEPHIPWKHELEMYQKLFDGIDPVSQRDLRNAAFHVLWHAKELELDREPLTADKL
jgi:hypothetical protein